MPRSARSCRCAETLLGVGGSAVIGWSWARTCRSTHPHTGPMNQVDEWRMTLASTGEVSIPSSRRHGAFLAVAGTTGVMIALLGDMDVLDVFFAVMFGGIAGWGLRVIITGRPSVTITSSEILVYGARLRWREVFDVGTTGGRWGAVVLWCTDEGEARFLRTAPSLLRWRRRLGSMLGSRNRLVLPSVTAPAQLAAWLTETATAARTGEPR